VRGTKQSWPSAAGENDCARGERDHGPAIGAGEGKQRPARQREQADGGRSWRSRARQPLRSSSCTGDRGSANSSTCSWRNRLC
jgi:hypothetical protein